MNILHPQCFTHSPPRLSLLGLLPLLVCFLLASSTSWAGWASRLILTPDGFETGGGNQPVGYQKPVVVPKEDGSFEVRIKAKLVGKMGKQWYIVRTTERLKGKERELSTEVIHGVVQEDFLKNKNADMARLEKLEAQAREKGDDAHVQQIRQAKDRWEESAKKYQSPVQAVIPLTGLKAELREIRFKVPAANRHRTYLFYGFPPRRNFFVADGGEQISVDLPAFIDQAVKIRK